MESSVGVLGLWVPLLAVFMLKVCQTHPIPDSSPLLQFGSQVRQRYLYTDDDRDTEAHLEIRQDGTVVGTTHRSPESKCGDGASRSQEDQGPGSSALWSDSECLCLVPQVSWSSKP